MTGGYSGVGFELYQILYGHNATFDIAGRSGPKVSSAISNIKNAFPSSSGHLEFILWIYPTFQPSSLAWKPSQRENYDLTSWYILQV